MVRHASKMCLFAAPSLVEDQDEITAMRGNGADRHAINTRGKSPVRQYKTKSHLFNYN